MAKKTSNSAHESKPTSEFPKTPITIDGKEYSLCFDFKKLGEAERFFRRQGHNVNLLIVLPELSFGGVQDAFPCLVHTWHPELSWAEAQALVTIQSVSEIAVAILHVLNPGADATVKAEQGAAVEAVA